MKTRKYKKGGSGAENRSTLRSKTKPKGKESRSKESKKSRKITPYIPVSKMKCKPQKDSLISKEDIHPNFKSLQDAIIGTERLRMIETITLLPCEGSLQVSKFTLFQNDEEIGNTQVMISTANIDDEEDIPSILVKWIEVNDKFKGQGYSKILLLYGILQYKVRFPHIQYAMLDDDSDACTQPSKNVYWKMGFVPASKVHSEEEVELPLNIKQNGPEMLLTFRSSRLQLFLNEVCDSLNPCVKSHRCKR